MIISYIRRCFIYSYINNYFKSIPGQQILKLLFWVRSIQYIIGCTQVTFIILIFPSFYKAFINSRPYSAVTTVIFPIVILLYIVIVTPFLYFLWTGIKQGSKIRLKICLVLSIMQIISSFGIGSVFTYEWLSFTKSTLELSWGIFYIILIHLHSFFEVEFLRRYSAKLDSPLVHQILDTYFNFENLELSPQFNLKSSDDKIQVSSGYEHIHCPTTPAVDIKKFKQYIIQPWMIAVDKKIILGEGSCGTVYKGFIKRDGKVVSVALKSVKNAESSLGDLLKEIKIMIHVGDHENIVKFYGLTSDASINGDCSIVMEYCMSSLQEFLCNNRNNFNLNDYHNIHNGIQSSSDNYIEIGDTIRYGVIDLLGISLGVVNGMEYLASKKVVHGDLSARNCLVQSDLCVKITDFGIAHRLYNYQMSPSVTCNKDEAVFPWRWSSIEVMEDLKFSEKSDVWSYGVLLFEIFTLGEQPYAGYDWSTKIPMQLRNGLRLRKPEIATKQIYDVMTRCWILDEQFRPNFSELQLELIKIKSTYKLSIGKGNQSISPIQ